MRHRTTFIAGLIAATVFAAPLAAQNVIFSGTGTSPNGVFSFSMLLPQSPIPHAFTAAAFDLGSVPSSITDGTTTQSGWAVTDFYSGGGFDLLFGNSTNAETVEIRREEGSQMFSGTTGHPTFKTGDYSGGFTTGSVGTTAGYRLNTISIALAPVTTPEPGSLALLGTGLFGLAPFVRKRTRNHTTHHHTI